jgi:peptidoglycan/xylan/chitin deacetylase (PgdA/CDA1 family)
MGERDPNRRRGRVTPVEIPDGHEFALCLTHDVDRPYKTYQSLYYAATGRDARHLLDLLPGRNPYWQFETVMTLEDELGVRSAFYFLREQDLFRDKPMRTWLRPKYWQLYVGRYSLRDPAIREVIEALDRGGWEVGLHGSYESYRDPERLRQEKLALERVLGDQVIGGRQHHLNLDVPLTWRYQAGAGLRYDATLGSARTYGFQHGYGVQRPFDDSFVVFPLTLMELTLPDVGGTSGRAWRACERLLEEARENAAVMTVLWHPCYFSESDYPGYAALYRRLIERAQEMDAWVGPPGELYATLDHGTGEPPGPVCEGDRSAEPRLPASGGHDGGAGE